MNGSGPVLLRSPRVPPPCRTSARGPRAIVIGAGIGGIATAARLARNGYRVTVLEKNEEAGGRCGRARMDRWTFDTGPTLFLMPAIIVDAFGALGERMEDHLSLVRVDPSYHLYFSDGSRLALTSDWGAMAEQLESFERGSSVALGRYLADAARLYRLAVPRFVQRDSDHLSEFLSPGNLLALARLRALRNHYVDAARYFSDERLRLAFTFQDLYMGLTPETAPATYALLQYAEFADGVWFPKGGMYRVVEALVEIAEAAGVGFEFQVPVARIDVEGDRAVGVTLANGRSLRADVLVADADLGYVYRRLLPRDSATRGVERKKLSGSSVTFLWGLDRRYPELGAHNLYFAGDPRDSYRALADGRGLSDDPNFYVHAPARLDPSMSPSGGDSLAVALPSGHRSLEGGPDWAAVRDRAREAVIRRLERAMLDHVGDHIACESAMTPLDWERRFNLVQGSIHGPSHTLSQMGYLRPHHRHGRYRNLFFVGASTHPGTGLPNVLLSAGFAVRTILGQDRADRARWIPPPVAGRSSGEATA
jgi:phytoene desaturase